MSQDTGETGPLPDDDALVARLRAAGEQARQLRAPATLQARLDGAYAAYHAGHSARQQAARAPLLGPRWLGPRWLAAGALASCLMAAVLWQARQQAGPHEHGLARTSPAPLAAQPLHAPPGSGRAMPGTAPVGTPPATAIATASADTPAASTSTSIATSAATSTALASDIGPRTSTAASAGASAGSSTDIPTLPRLPRDALPVLSLDASTLRIATTAPVMPSLSMQMPEGTRAAAPTLPSVEPREDAGKRDAPALPSTPPSQAVHAGANHGVA